MVVQWGGPSPEIIRPNMESQDAMGRDNDIVDFQEQKKESNPLSPPQVWR